MKAPRCSWPWLVLAALAVPAVVRGCVSAARAAEDLDAVAAGISSVDILRTGGGITGALLSLAVASWAVSSLVDRLGQHGLLPSRKAPTPAPVPTLDEASSARLAVWTTRDDARAIARELVQELRADCDSAHERVRLTLAEHERRQTKIEDRAEAHRVEAASTLGHVQVALGAVERALANLQGRLSPRESA